MPDTLNLNLQADRRRASDMVIAVAKEAGAVATLCPLLTKGSRYVVDITAPGGLSLTLSIDKRPAGDPFVLAWYVASKCNATLSDRFGLHMGTTVAEGHRRKCTALAADFGTALDMIRRGLRLADAGDAYGVADEDYLSRVPAYMLKGEMSHHDGNVIAYWWDLADSLGEFAGRRIMTGPEARLYLQESGVILVSAAKWQEMRNSGTIRS